LLSGNSNCVADAVSIATGGLFAIIVSLLINR
jgi:hypothetical protein